MVVAGKWRLAIAATGLLGACYAAAVPPRPPPPPPALAVPVIESGPEERGEPTPKLKEELKPKPAPVEPEAEAKPPPKPTTESKPVPKAEVEELGFTRRLDRAKIEARGAPVAKAGFNQFFMQAGAAFANKTWGGDARRELLAYLRRAAVKKDDAFTRPDAAIVAQLQAGSGLEPSGKLNDETMAVLFAMGLRFSPRKTSPRNVRLDFYPAELEDRDAWNREIDEKVTKEGGNYRDVDPPAGEGSIYVRIDGSIVAVYRGRGGPPRTLEDIGDHIAAPTEPGVYRLGPAHVHVTSNWYFSQIPWGAEIRRSDAGVEYRSPGGRSAWAWATKTPATTLKEPLERSDFEGLPTVTRNGETFLVWNKNDFGPIAWNLVPGVQYIHTTPEGEAAAFPPDAGPPDDAGTRAPTNLTCSHGCVHIEPVERDEMMKTGYLGPEIEVVVRSWEEHLLPDLVRREMMTGTGAAAPW